MQFVAVRFRQSDLRTYTYHNDGDPVAVGDDVMIPDLNGWKRARVVALPTEPPAFVTKPILGLAPEQETDL